MAKACHNQRMTNRLLWFGKAMKNMQGAKGQIKRETRGEASKQKLFYGKGTTIITIVEDSYDDDQVVELVKEMNP